MILTEEHIRLIRQKVDEAGTLKAFADEIGVYPQTVGRWISGEHKEVKGKNINKLISALGLRNRVTYPMAGIADLSILQDRSAPCCETQRYNWYHFADWASQQPANTQHAIINVAKLGGYTP